MTRIGFDVLIQLGSKLAEINKSRDPEDAKKLYEWFQTGGLESTRESVMVELKDIFTTTEGKTYRFNVTPFYDFKGTTFEAPAYTTLDELRHTIAETFGTKVGNIDWSDLWEGIEPLSWTTRVGQFIDRVGDDNPLNVDIKPSCVDIRSWPPWGISSEGKVTVPVTIYGVDPRGADMKQYLIPITAHTTYGEFVNMFRQVTGIEPRANVFSIGADPISDLRNFWTVWGMYNFEKPFGHAPPS